MAKDKEYTDVSDYFGGLYDNTKSVGASPVVGQFVWAPVLERQGKPWIADVVRSAPTTHDTAELNIRYYDSSRDFRGKGKRLPVHALQLTENHELMLARAKKRLCLVVGKTEAVTANSIPEGLQRKKALNAFPEQYILAPIYSASSPAKPTSFGSVMSARIRCLMYPEFFWISRSGGVVSNDSVLRLDHLFLNPASICIEMENLFIKDEALSLVLNQLLVILDQEPEIEYLEVQKLLVSELPSVFL